MSAEDGAVGGAEMLVLGFLVLVTGTLLVAGTWAVVDAKFAVASAAREAARAAVEAPGGADLEAVATEAATAAFDGHRSALDPELELVAAGADAADGPVARCTRLSATVRATVPSVALPWIGRLLPVTVRSTHSEVVDPYRDGLEGEARCAR